MPTWVLSRMVLLGLMRTPWLSAVMAGLLATIPFLHALRPPASEGGALELLKAWSLPCGLLGASLAVARLGERQAFLQRVGGRDRLGGEWGGCMTAILYLQLPILLGAFLAGSGPGLDLARTLADIFSADLHLAGLALLLLAPPMPATARLPSLLALAWLLPTLLAAGDAPPALIAPLAFDAPLQLPGCAPLSVLIGLGLALAAGLCRTAPNSSSAR